LSLKAGGWSHERAARANLSLYANGHRLKVKNVILPRAGSEDFTFTVGREILEELTLSATGIVLYEGLAGADRGF